MSHFYGTLQGSRGEATRCGTKNSGVTTHAPGWRGAIRVDVYERDGVDRFDVVRQAWQGSGGNSVTLASGELDSQDGAIERPAKPQPNARALLTAIADEWTNDYLTPAAYAEHNGITEEQARTLITLAQEVRDSKHPDA